MNIEQTSVVDVDVAAVMEEAGNQVRAQAMRSQLLYGRVVALTKENAALKEQINRLAKPKP